MIQPESPSPPITPTRLPFPCASVPQIAEAVQFAAHRLRRYFPTLHGPAWYAALLQLQPDLFVGDPDVSLDWHGLAGLVAGLDAAPELAGHARPVSGPYPDDLTQYLRTYQRQALAALAERAANPSAYAACADALVLALARGAAGGSGAPRPPASGPGPNPVREATPKPPETNAAPPTTPLPDPSQRDLPDRTATTHGSSPRRTFRDFVQNHPRPNGKIGFTVRELCRTMRISAVSLADALDNPGRLTLEAISALAALMGKNPLHVISILLPEVYKKRPRKRKKRAS